MLDCKHAIERSEVFKLNFANVTVVTWTDKLVPSVDSNFSDIVLLVKEQIFIILPEIEC